VQSGRTEQEESYAMDILLIVIVVIVVLFLLGYLGRGRLRR
jgi:hypothetical protein